jgi:hypothetical protein
MPAEGHEAAPRETGTLAPGAPAPEVTAAEVTGSGVTGPRGSQSVPTRSLLHRWLVAFGRFWWDFLVGDTPELLIGVLIALGVVALLVKGAGLNSVAVVGFPVMVAVMLGLSVYRARPKR